MYYSILLTNVYFIPAVSLLCDCLEIVFSAIVDTILEKKYLTEYSHVHLAITHYFVLCLCSYTYLSGERMGRCVFWEEELENRDL